MKSVFAVLAFTLVLAAACENRVDESPVSELSKEFKSQENLNGTAENVEMTDSAVFMAADEYKEDEEQKKQPVPKQPTKTEPLVTKELDKKIVKSANLSVETKDFKAYSKKLSDRIKALGGYVSHETQNSSDYKIESEVVVRVPVDKFDTAVDELVGSADKVTEKTISAEDQTREFVDGRSRLEAKKQVRLRYLDLLKQAKNMLEIIEVQSEINSIQEEIEVVTGRINQINQTSAMSTINLSYYQILDATARDSDDDGFFDRLLSGFAKGWKWIGELMIGLITIWPLLLILGVGGFFLRRKLLATKPA